ncbi:ricin-type beta-trefoil lectin domain protein [Kitasatospora griseola]|uniref:ricin-type beta-trefoil lectin domain protein n=1 Tax=Kitasatospora griseola TaxID=2064 RepID=UPI00166FF38E|nr:ricin-type beta-trefoil lectin domain protein [Kitasatospora griseola]GGR01960.1 hypothetical protein GCM10010195_67140 [Kitasatospora griseola]
MVASAALAATVLTGLASTAPALADTPAGTSAPSAVEDGAYPGAAQILADKGITLTRGDGGITLANCTQPSGYQIKVFARTAIEDDEDTICFAAPGASGYLAFTIPDAYRITTYNRSVRASLSTDQKPTETTDVPANGTKGIGETLDPSTHAVLLELRVTGSTATAPAGQPADPATAFTARLAIGDQGRACTGALVDPMWVLTAKSCFADDPSTVTAGAPKTATTATVGRTDLNTTGGHLTKVVELAPHANRDLVMARLQTPITDIAPLALSATAAASGGTLTTAGYGRTATDWTPGKLHTPVATTGTVAANGFDLAPTASGLICKGDAGAPLWRTENGKPALAGIVSRSWQGGCLGTDATETRTGAYAERTDGLASWIAQQTSRSYEILNPASGRCLNLSGAGPWANSTPIIAWDCTLGANNEKFQITADGQLRNPTSGRCLNVSGAGPVWNNGTPIILFDCVAGAGNEKFEWTTDGQLRNPASGRCLNISGAGPWNNGTPIILFDCNNQPNEKFQLVADNEIPNPVGRLKNPASGRCLNISGAGPVWPNSTPIILFDCNGENNELFQLTADGQLYNYSSNRCLNVSGAGPTWDNGTPIILFDCVAGAGNEKFEWTTDGQLRNPASGRCLNISGAGPVWNNHTPIILFDCNNQPNEKFQLVNQA